MRNRNSASHNRVCLTFSFQLDPWYPLKTRVRLVNSDEQFKCDLDPDPLVDPSLRVVGHVQPFPCVVLGERKEGVEIACEVFLGFVPSGPWFFGRFGFVCPCLFERVFLGGPRVRTCWELVWHLDGEELMVAIDVVSVLYVDAHVFPCSLCCLLSTRCNLQASSRASFSKRMRRTACAQCNPLTFGIRPAVLILFREVRSDLRLLAPDPRSCMRPCHA